MRVFSVIKHPLLTEKSYKLQGQECAKYTFVVEKNATKPEILKAFENIFEIKPIKINIMNVRPSQVRGGTKHPGTKSGFKKAIITLPKNVKLNIDGEDKSAPAKEEK